MVTSIVSSITKIPVNREIAMTGEVTVTGQVLPIGGLKEKLLAAHRAGIKKVLIPTENKKDLVEVPKTILETMEIIPVKNVDEVLKVALTKPLKRVEWVEVDQISEKNKEYFELDSANIPTDIQVMINDGEIAMILLRLVEIIGEDNLKDLGTESLYFIISTLNKLGIDKIRNDMILKTIPLKA